MRDTVRILLIGVVAIGLFTGLSVAPVTAATDDGLLGEDDSLIQDDGIAIGGDDGVTVGVDDGVNASVAGDDGVQAGAGPNSGLEASVAGQEVSDGAPTDVTSQVDSIGDTGGGAPESAPVSAVDGAGVSDALPGGDGGLPSAGNGQGINLTESTGVQACDLTRLNANDLPTGSLPGLDSVPAELAPPGVPTNLLTTETIVGLATGGAPGTCEVADLNDPQLDPTDPPTEPDYTGSVIRSETGTDKLAYWAVYSGTLNESGDGPSFMIEPGFIVTQDTLHSASEYRFNVGEGDYGIRPTVKRNNDSVRLRGVALVVGKNAGGELECTDLKEFDGDLSEESLANLGPCEYELVGIPSLATPEDVVEILDSAGSGDAPVDPSALPIDPDNLLGL